MKKAIEDFIQQKHLAKNSQTAYRYDLEQFLESCAGQIDAGKLALYQASLAGLKPAAARRKLSAVNQFLYYLYETGQVDQYHRLKPQQPRTSTSSSYVREDLSIIFEESVYLDGQLIAALMGFLGLTPAEISQLKADQIDQDFGIVMVQKGASRRVLELPNQLAELLSPFLEGTYLFDKKGAPYSRQWFFNQLTTFVTSIGKSDWTAQKLREQYILHQLDAGTSLDELAKNLGLKTRLTLEKYR